MCACMPSPAELKTVGDDSCSTLEEELEKKIYTAVVRCVFDLLIAF